MYASKGSALKQVVVIRTSNVSTFWKLVDSASYIMYYFLLRVLTHLSHQREPNTRENMHENTSV